MKTELEFNDIIIDINFEEKDWDEIADIAQHFVDQKYFNGDEFKCTIGAGIIYVVLKNDKEALSTIDVQNKNVH